MDITNGYAPVEGAAVYATDDILLKVGTILLPAAAPGSRVPRRTPICTAMLRPTCMCQWSKRVLACRQEPLLPAAQRAAPSSQCMPTHGLALPHQVSNGVISNGVSDGYGAGIVARALTKAPTFTNVTFLNNSAADGAYMMPRGIRLPLLPAR